MDTRFRSASRRLRAALMSSALAIILVGSSDAVGQARTPDPSDRRDRLQFQIAGARDDLADLSAQAAAVVRRLDHTRTELARARASLDAATADLARAADRTADLQTRLRAAQVREAAGVAALARNEQQTSLAEQRRDTLARLAYETGGSGDLVAFVDIESARDFADRAYVVQEVGAHQGGVIEELAQIRRVRVAEQAALATARREVAQLTLQARAAEEQAAFARAQRAKSTRELTTLATTQAVQQRDVESRRATEQARVERLQSESDRLTRLLAARAAAERARAATSARARTARSGAARPESNATVRKHSDAPQRSRAARRNEGAALSDPVSAPLTSGFGMRHHPILDYARLHTGADFGAACGVPVYAAADGEVVRAGWAGGYGNQIVLAHEGPLATSYSHLSRIAASAGHVRRGRLIGYVGTTGLSTGCHLHFETRVNGAPVDPAGHL